MKTQHTPTTQDIWDHSQASLQNLWSDCPELYQRVVRAVNVHDLLCSALRSIINSCPATKEYDDIVAIAEKAIARAEGKE